ncbi:hypothetical protein C8R43DRAFT_1016142 [Mycena crocata]|nr:hypothetical protein C8R43DRAFT_1016142 [Mycena crocata]
MGKYTSPPINTPRVAWLSLCVPMSLSRVALPSELWDAIIDHLHNDEAALSICALVCRNWVPASRFHRFEALAVSRKSGLRAVRLNALLASPHGTIVPAVRTLSFPDALAAIQIRNPQTGQTHLKTLFALVPHAEMLQHVRSLALSDLPWPLLRALKNVEQLTLTGLCVGPCLLDIATALPRLAHLMLQDVTAVPFRGWCPPHSTVNSSALVPLHTITIRGSSIAFLGWLSLVAPHTKNLSIDVLTAREVDYLIGYVSVLGSALEVLELGFFGNTLNELLLSNLIAPCPQLKLLRLQFATVEDAQRFFAFGGALLSGGSSSSDMCLELVVPGVTSGSDAHTVNVLETDAQALDALCAHLTQQQQGLTAVRWLRG